MSFKKNYFSALLENLSKSSEREAQGLLALSSPVLRNFLRERLTNGYGGDALLADPVFEATFGWKNSDETVDSLADSHLLNAKLAANLKEPPNAKPDFLAEEYTFPGNRHLFTHQLESWKILNKKQPKSLVVTSGTGSGKTECFLIPVLNQIANEIDAKGASDGVRALFVYPLNALINSQENRLNAWTDGFGGKVRHCLYTGALPEETPKREQVYQGQVIDRKTLRENPPQLLVTNATMLEYMLVRQEDAPILEKSAGKLKWIILDEAHTYIGSQAAEMALLLRRVMLAFKVNPKEVRFVATSATFGSDSETIKGLKNFLADIGGISAEQVAVVRGKRDIPKRINNVDEQSEDSLEAIAKLDADSEVSQARFNALLSSPTAHRIHDLFSKEGYSLSGLKKHLKLSSKEILAWLDLLSGTRDAHGQVFLPLRGHIFHNVVSSLKACIDPHCPCKKNTLLDTEDWPYGMVYLQECTECQCGAPVLPIVSCKDCNELYLQADETNTGALQTPNFGNIDEFSLDIDEEEDEEEQEPEEEDLPLKEAVLSPRLVVNRPGENVENVFFDKETKRLTAQPSDKTISLVLSARNKTECPSCETRTGYRTARVGAPSTMSSVIGALLDFCPEDASPEGKPFQGRKMISFTDSRQGTARIAAKLQQDSERNRIRGLIYYKILLAAKTNHAAEIQDLENEKSDLLLFKEGETSESKLDVLNRRIKQKESKIQKLKNEAPKVSWEEMVEYLAKTPDVEIHMLPSYTEIAPKVFPDGSSRNLAGMLLAREFFRRPKKANSLETMGLVQVVYPALDEVKSVPSCWPEKDLGSWKSYLKFLIDYFIRANAILNITKDWIKLMGAPVSPKFVEGPTKEYRKLTPQYKRWPQIYKKPSRLRAICILCGAFDLDQHANKGTINHILICAWQTLKEIGIIEESGYAFMVNFHSFSFTLPQHSYICPITRRFIDTPFKGLSPYTPTNFFHGGVIKVEDGYGTMPRVPGEILNSDFSPEERTEKIRRWEDQDAQVIKFREQGLWDNITDTVVEGGHYYKAAEHSAQQPKSRLQHYEAQFKDGRLNLLSCSTTMEMGVDIGGITVVAMNNVPPHPANYLQRAGRAGRRNEGRALAVTICRNTPHDQNVFQNPLWAFTTKMPLPKVSLQSEALVRRHVNSWILSYFLKETLAAKKMLKLNSGAFFLAEENLPSTEMRFKEWCNAQIKDMTNAVKHALESVTERTILAAITPENLVRTSVEEMEKIAKEWMKEHDILEEQREAIGNKRSKAYKAMDLRILRLENEYLLKELVQRRFLPGYGFPTNVVSFDNTNIQNIDKNRHLQSREDNRARIHELASRDRVTGLREYAPGAELVMDGLVYRSAGITLNWHIPSSQSERKELQLFKKSWICRSCGSSGTAQDISDIYCDHCGAEIQQADIKRFIVPAGFAVDFYETPNNNISQMNYIPINKPRINIASHWVNLANPALGCFESSDNALIFHYTGGKYNQGFAICLDCGRAEPMHGDENSENEGLPKIFQAEQSHRRLRGDKNDDGNGVCSGSDNGWKIQPNIFLGDEYHTDALEILLKNSQNGEWLHDDVTGFSIAVALREAIAEQLGIMTEELGCDCQDIKKSGQAASAIRIYDLRSGGYTTQIISEINSDKLWKRVIAILDCDCASACEKCLLSYDTRYDADRLDRTKAQEWINEEWLAKLAVPEEYKFFGNNTRAEIYTLKEAVNAAFLKDKDFQKIVIYFQKFSPDWDIEAADGLRQQTSEWLNMAGKTATLEFAILSSAFGQLSDDQKRALMGYHSLGVAIRLYDRFPKKGDMRLNVGLWGKNSIAWASNNLSLNVPGESWDSYAEDSLIVKGEPPRLQAVQELDDEDLFPQSSDVIEISNQINGDIMHFAERFWSFLKQESPALINEIFSKKIMKVQYQDRYVKSPLTVKLLVNTIHYLKEKRKGDNFAIEVWGTKYTEKLTPRNYFHNFVSHEQRDACLEKYFAELGMTNLTIISQGTLDHFRKMMITLESGKQIVIQFDQGFGFWLGHKKNHDNAFNFKEVNSNIDILKNLQCYLAGRGDMKTYVTIYVNE